ncbi:MAG: winged helix-turn-helix domain-containing protein [Pseudomonadota bacterium]
MPDREIGREQLLTFGPFQLVRSRKLLLQDGRPVRLGSRAIDLLMVLVERAGEVVGKNELIALVWPNTVVEENNLRVHLTALRKSLGAGQPGARYIINVAGRGYSFVAPVERTEGRGTRLESSTAIPGNLPAAISRPIGRALAVDTVAHLLGGHRLVTVIGPGGIGKSTVAVAAAERIGAAFPAGVFFTDLTAVTDAAHLPAALASAIGTSVPVVDPVRALIAHVRDAQMLLLVDNCEHLIDDVAEVALRLLRGSPHLRILATSREPLQVDGEQVYQLSSLESPAESGLTTAEEAMTFPAVQLFAERATNGFENFAITDANAALVARICRRLDGVPLAIEIVAARAGLVGVHALELGDEDAEILAARGRRTASSRHRSLRATLDWSYRQLTGVERKVLMRLSVFRGWFTAPAAVAVVADELLDEGAALEALMSLVVKSLLATDISEQEFRYRLLHVTRLYAAEHLQSTQDAQAAWRRHGQYLCEFLERSILEMTTLSRDRWLRLHQSSIEDIRALMDWAFGPQGDALLGAQLTAAAGRFGFQVALLDEFRSWTEMALRALRQLETPQPALELRLTMAQALLRNRMADPDSAVDADINRMIALTRDGGVPRNRIAPLSHRALVMLDFGDYATSASALAELEATARQEDDAFAAFTADRVGAMVCHWSGDHPRARQLAERVLRHPLQAAPPTYSPVAVDRRVSMRVVLARILWLEGCADQARELAAEALSLAGSDSPHALCDALGHAVCPIAFWRGDVQEATAMTALLLEHSRRYTLTRWHIAANCFESVLHAMSGTVATDPAGDDVAQVAPLPGLQRDLMGTISERWFDATTMARGEHRLAGWCTPELLRRNAQLQLRQGTAAGMRMAEASLQTSLEVARDQGAFGWELRSATMLAELWREQGRSSEAVGLLEPLVTRIPEGEGTRDVVNARSSLSKL